MEIMSDKNSIRRWVSDQLQSICMEAFTVDYDTLVDHLTDDLVDHLHDNTDFEYGQELPEMSNEEWFKFEEESLKQFETQ